MHSDNAYTVPEVSTLITVWALMGVEPGKSRHEGAGVCQLCRALPTETCCLLPSDTFGVLSSCHGVARASTMVACGLGATGVPFFS